MAKDGRIKQMQMALMCLAASFVLLFLCSQSSPLYPTNTWVDANCLLTVGRAMKNGAVVYRDIYEQKGPTLYLIHWIAALISDTSFLGVFVLEVLSLAAALYAGSHLLLRRMSRWAALACSVLIMAFVLCGGSFMKGDSAEEFCLPYLTAALHLVFAQYGSQKGPMHSKALFACGLLAGVTATIKYTALGLFVGLCAAEGVFALQHGGFKRALKSAGVFLAGMMLPIAAWCVYFAAQGALSDFYTAYIYNNIFLYSEKIRTIKTIVWQVVSSAKDNAVWVLLAVLGIAAMAADGRLSLQLRFAVMMMAACAFAAVFLPGYTFAYYPLVLSVFAFAGAYGLAGCACRFLALRRAGSVLCVSAWLLAAVFAFVFSPNAPVRGVKREELAQTRLAAYIHPGATLLQYSHLDDGLYLASGTLPQEKYFVRLNVRYDDMLEELDRYLEEGLPDYVLVSWEELPARFEQYQWIATDAGYDDANRINKLLYLYRRK
ncbi:MAG: hypothetical protein IJ381_02625 [Clostridia bacterium]|nr:hypothetical protein [Clostridia bacterium]